jgi:GNAT superfamily N-acetyltransferase
VPSSVDLSTLRVRPLHEDYSAVCSQFVCGDTSEDQDLADFLRDDALRLQTLKIVSTYVAFQDDQAIGYVALLPDALNLSAGERRKVKTGSVKMSGNDHPIVPALKVARLAVSKDHQRQGVGEYLLRFALFTALDISGVAGCRFLTLDALPNRVEYYQKRGFVLNTDDKYKGKERPSMRYDIFSPNPAAWATPPV